MRRSGPKNDEAVVRRLQSMDAMLASEEGLHLPTTAEVLCVSERTIRRSLRLLAELEHPTRYQSSSNTHHYLEGVTPIFTRTTGKGHKSEH